MWVQIHASTWLQCLFPVPDLRQEVCHVDFLVLHLHDPRVIQHPPRTRSSSGILLQATIHFVSITNEAGPERYLPTRNKILEVITPFDSQMGLILQLWNRLSDDICQQVNQAGTRVAAAIIRLAERKPMLCDFKESDT
jgi:hypothetical protein